MRLGIRTMNRTIRRMQAAVMTLNEHPCESSPDLDDIPPLLFHVHQRMKSSAVIPLLLLAATLAADAKPRVAIVRIRDIYAALPSTVIHQQEIQNERNDILKDQRGQDLRKLLGELQTLGAQLEQSAKSGAPATEIQELARTYEIKRQETQTIQQEFESFRAERDQEINKDLVSGIREILTRITSTSEKLAKERGYDIVLDASGSTNSGVPFVLYSKEAPDLTDEVQSAIMKSEPPMPANPQLPATATAPGAAHQTSPAPATGSPTQPAQAPQPQPAPTAPKPAPQGQNNVAPNPSGTGEYD